MRNKLKIYIVIVVLLFTTKTIHSELKLHLSGTKEVTLDSLKHIVENDFINYKDKIRMYYSNNFCEDVPNEEHIVVTNRLLAESKRRRDANGILLGYATIAYLNDEWGYDTLSRIYIDSASAYVETATDALALARFHYLNGLQLVNTPYGRRKGHREFELAMDLYIKSGYAAQYLSYITYNISVYSTHQPDTVFTKKMIEFNQHILDKNYTPFVDYTLSSLKSTRFKMLHEVSKDERNLDSAIYYERKRIKLFDDNPGMFRKNIEFEVINSYLLIAEYLFLQHTSDTALITKSLEQAKERCIETDDYIKSRINYIEAIVCYMRADYTKAVHYISEAENNLINMEDGIKSSFLPATCYPLEATYYAFHSRILTSMQRYNEAFEYNSRKNALKIRIRETNAHELEQLYNTEQDDLKIEQLKSVNDFQVKLTSMLIIIALLFIITIILLFLWFYRLKFSLRHRSALVRAEREKAALNLKLKEEQEAKSELEKYEVISEYRLKELELESANAALKQLQTDKQALDRQIEAYTRKIQGHISEHKSEQDDEELWNAMCGELTRLIDRRVENGKAYSKLLNAFDASYLWSLKQLYDGNLSYQYMKYCVCFAIGIEAAKVADCFSIEQSSVHIIRYRLRKKFGISNSEEDLNMFLRRLNKKLSDYPPIS
jgi:hypothetical protein